MVEENGPRILFECPTLNFRCNLRSVAPEGRSARARIQSTLLYFKIYRMCAFLHLIYDGRKMPRCETRNPNISASNGNSRRRIYLRKGIAPPAFPFKQFRFALERTNSERWRIHRLHSVLGIRRVIALTCMCNLIKRSVIRSRNYLSTCTIGLHTDVFICAILSDFHNFKLNYRHIFGSDQS